MKKLKPILLFSLAILLACNNSNDKKQEQPKSDNKMDAARSFIRATLDGKFEEAKDFMLQDSINLNYLEVGQRSRQNADQNTKDGYRTASIRFHETINKNDSTSIIVYSNSFKNDHDSLKMIKKQTEWLVDLKYLFEHDADTIKGTTISKDTLK
jgi:hypothetical protein